MLVFFMMVPYTFCFLIFYLIHLFIDVLFINDNISVHFIWGCWVIHDSGFIEMSRCFEIDREHEVRCQIWYRTGPIVLVLVWSSCSTMQAQGEWNQILICKEKWSWGVLPILVYSKKALSSRIHICFFFLLSFVFSCVSYSCHSQTDPLI